jgi:hypothetical protein
MARVTVFLPERWATTVAVGLVLIYLCMPAFAPNAVAVRPVPTNGTIQSGQQFQDTGAVILPPANESVFSVGQGLSSNARQLEEVRSCTESGQRAVHCTPRVPVPAESTNESEEGWVRLNPVASPWNPSYFEGAYDPAENLTIMYQSGCNTPPSDCHVPATWAFSKNNWTRFNTTTSPGVELGASVVYDVADKYLLLYGGSNYSLLSNSTWKFSNGQWTNITQGTAPGPEYGAAAAYDAYDRYVLLFSGGNLTGTLTRTWSFTDGKWTQVNVTGTRPTPLGPYNTNPMVYDPRLDSVVYFDATGNYTYLYQSGNWREVYAPLPESLQGGGSLAFDPASGLVLYLNGGSSPLTYAFNGSTWSAVQLPTNPPSAPMSLFTYDGSANGILYLTGLDSNQTWLFGRGNVSFEVSPSAGGRILMDGSLHNDSASALLPYGIYLPPKLFPYVGFHGTNLSTSGGLVQSNGTDSLIGNATILGQFDADPSVLIVSKPSGCGVEFNNTHYSSGSLAFFAPGTFALEAPACLGVQFDRWLTTSNATVNVLTSNRTSVTLTGSAELTALYFASLTFEVSPAFVGTILFNGSPVSLNAPQAWVAQNYSLHAVPAPGWYLAGYSVTGGVTIAPGEATLLGSGSITANFVPYPSVGFESSLPACNSFLFNGSSYPTGSNSSFLLGNYPVRAPTCSDALFEHWSASGNVTVASPDSFNTTANVTGNGTLTADYGVAAWVNFTVQPSAAAGSITWNGTALRNWSYFETLTGDYPVSAHPAAGWHFLDWKTEGGLSLDTSSFALSSNASLTVVFQINATTPGGNQSAGSGFGLTEWEWVALGVVVIGALALAVVLFRRRRTVDGTPEDQDNP